MTDKTFLQLADDFQTNIDNLNSVLIGDENTTVTIGGVAKPTISKALQDKWNSVEYGVVVFPTYAALDAYTPLTTEQKGSFKVTNDPDTTKIGYYSWVSGTTYTKDASFVIGDIDVFNTTEPVTGKAVADYIADAANLSDGIETAASARIAAIEAEADSKLASFEFDAQALVTELEEDVSAAIGNITNAVGSNIVGDFAIGITVTNVNDVLQYDSGLYRYTGTLPYTTDGATPDTDSGTWVATSTGTLSSIARRFNVLDSAVIYADDNTTVLDNVEYIYDSGAQTVWSKPTLKATGEKISSVSGSTLITTGGTYLLIDVDAYQLESTFHFAEKVLMQASERPVRIMMDGTSISTFDGSPNQVLVEQLKKIYGDAQLRHVQLAGLGGSYETAYSGWEKQPFGGVFYHRIRGNSGATSFVQKVYASKIEILYSTETDGGSFDIDVDGDIYTIDCSGSQSYGNKLTIDVELGAHTVTFNPPASGYVYPEHMITTIGLNGIEVIDGCFGGSTLQQHGTVRAASGAQVSGITIAGFNGIDAVFNRDDVDMVIYSGSVNDAGSYSNTSYTSLFNRIVETTYNNNAPLMIQAEMAGHYARPSDAGHTNFNNIKAKFYAADRDNVHVHVVDWDKLTRIDDLDEYATRYYTLTSGTGSSSETEGDYIHPTIEGLRVGIAAMCNALGVPSPKYSSRDEMRRDKRRNGYFAEMAKDVSVYDNNYPLTLQQTGWASKLTGGEYKSVPLFESDLVHDHGRLIDVIEAAGTEDELGKYIDYTNGTPYLANLPANTRFTVTLLLAGSGTLGINNGTVYFDGKEVGSDAGPSSFSFSFGDNLTALTFEYETDDVNWVQLTGKLYEGSCATLTDGVAVVTKSKRRAHKPNTAVYPDALLKDDIDYNTQFHGQVYKDEYGVRKEMVGSCLKYDADSYNAAVSAGDDTLTNSYLARAVYRCLDRTTALFQQVGFYGTLTEYTDNAMTGGIGYTTSYNPIEYRFSAFDISAEPTLTISVPAYGRDIFGIVIYFYNGSTNGYRWLKEDGTWTATTQVYSMRSRYDAINGMYSITIPTTGIGNVADALYIGRVDPSLRVKIVSGSAITGQGMGDATLCLGKHAMI